FSIQPNLYVLHALEAGQGPSNGFKNFTFILSSIIFELLGEINRSGFILDIQAFNCRSFWQDSRKILRQLAFRGTFLNHEFQRLSGDSFGVWKLHSNRCDESIAVLQIHSDRLCQSLNGSAHSYRISPRIIDDNFVLRWVDLA